MKMGEQRVDVAHPDLRHQYYVASAYQEPQRCYQGNE
jgi:hypothetical protein